MPTFSLNDETHVILSLSWMNILKCFTKNSVIMSVLFIIFNYHSFQSAQNGIHDYTLTTPTPSNPHPGLKWDRDEVSSTPSMLTITKKGKPSSSSTPYQTKAPSNSNHIPIIGSDLSSFESDED